MGMGFFKVIIDSVNNQVLNSLDFNRLCTLLSEHVKRVVYVKRSVELVYKACFRRQQALMVFHSTALTMQNEHVGWK